MGVSAMIEEAKNRHTDKSIDCFMWVDQREVASELIISIDELFRAVEWID